MAVARAVGRVLLEHAKRGGFSGRVLQFGRQRIYLTADELADAAGRPRSGGRAGRTFLSDAEFFAGLGFVAVESCDVSPADSPTHLLDLQDPVPPELVGRYDAVFDGGTLEHILDVPAVMANIHRLLRAGGCVVHVSPMSNYADHGFYSFSPTFFVDYYTANGWEVERVALLEHPRRWARSRWTVWDYHSGVLDHLAIGGLERHAFLVLVIARRTVDATANARVAQGSARGGAAASTHRGAGTLARVRSRVARSAFGRRFLMPVAIRLSPLLPTRVVPIAPRRLKAPRRRY